MSSSDNTNTFPILRLPLEIRFMIYRELWTHLADPGNEDLDDDDSSSEEEDNYDSDSEDLEQVTQHLEMVTTIKNLSNSCHQVRDELIAEFFTRVLSKTQIHVGDVYPPEPRYDSSGRRPVPRGKILQLPLINRKIFKVLQSSSLFTQYIQHVSVRWDGCYCAESKRMNRDMRHFGVWYTDAVRATGLDWLAQCENLKTLEVAITNSESAQTRADGGWSPHDTVEGLEFCKHCRLQLVSMPKTLEKVKFRMFIDYDKCWVYEWAVIDPNWEADLAEWFWRERATVKPSLAAPRAEMNPQEDGTHQESVVHEIKHHLGAVEVHWFLLDSI